jgi:RNA polymerase-binding transcription factor DksA
MAATRAALTRMALSTYGSCRICGEPIALQRCRYEVQG